MSDYLSVAREAVQRHHWSDAVAEYTAAERQGASLGPEDLLSLAAASWWSGEIDGAVDALERAYRSLLDAERRSEAAIVALRLCELAAQGMNFAVAQGWLARAQRLLADEPESVAHAWLEFILAVLRLLQHGDLQGSLELAEHSLQLARRYRSPDVESLALAIAGQALLRMGRWAEGLASLDEAAATAVAGTLDPKSACDVYCNTIAACSDLGDYRRAGQWIAEADRWMERREITGYRGVCRVHRAELKRLHGAWSEAEREARDACDELQRFRMLDAVGFAYYQIGEVRLHIGDLDGAEEAFERAYEFDRPPQPGHSLLLLARGDVNLAAKSIARALSAESEYLFQANDLLQRARLLSAQVEIALASGDTQTATTAAAELGMIADSFDSEVLRASAMTARGSLELAEGNAAAIDTLGRAWRMWHSLELPYETARARTLLGRAHLFAGDRSAARLALRAAASGFERLGAARDLSQLVPLLEELQAADMQRLTKTFMFTDIVTSTELVRLIGDDAWKQLITWHDRILRGEFSAHGGVVVRHTGDGFFVTFESAANAVHCAVAVQRRFALHRHEHGFAPSLRIGIHTAEANPHGGDYAGHGVHVAARVSALAGREEILISRDALLAAGPLGVAVSDAWPVELKGVAAPVEVHTIDWT